MAKATAYLMESETPSGLKQLVLTFGAPRDFSKIVGALEVKSTTEILERLKRRDGAVFDLILEDFPAPVTEGQEREATVAEVSQVAKNLGYGGDYEIYFSEDFPNLVEIIGHEWKTLPVGHLSKGPEAIANLLMDKAPGWAFKEADRSGIYLTRHGLDVRFC